MLLKGVRERKGGQVLEAVVSGFGVRNRSMDEQVASEEEELGIDVWRNRKPVECRSMWVICLMQEV